MHMTYRRDYFIKFEATNESNFVKFANDEILPGVGRGTIKIREKVND